MNVFGEMRRGKAYDIRDKDYQEQVHGEIDRGNYLCQQINQTDTRDKETLRRLEGELLGGSLPEETFLTPPFHIDCGNRVFLGKNVFANHNLTVMSLGTVTIEDGVMLGPEVGLFTVNNEPKNIRVLRTKEIHIKKNAWIGARVSILPGVTIGENAIVGTGSVVTKDVPDHSVAVGVPAKIIKTLD
ncbi:MAG: DapH/DapD/GlmU-related protein [Megasphaera massiliensis]|uniref:DapH/DapD/GlmU-related protein n=1 Tax=Megasphaera massiliensis TaxID=1232428 RepID=UPI002A7511AC|nr:DapH/DapD/GlmU-related protein [Megasphaera massiliensis]MDY2966569.1 DapH/DapD/GlmU-related protein [Megasphaera massiliensis]